MRGIHLLRFRNFLDALQPTSRSCQQVVRHAIVRGMQLSSGWHSLLRVTLLECAGWQIRLSIGGAIASTAADSADITTREEVFSLHKERTTRLLRIYELRSIRRAMDSLASTTSSARHCCD